MAYTPLTATEVTKEDWQIANVLTPATTVSTCNSIDYLGGATVFDAKTKLMNFFHIPDPHFKAKISFKVVFFLSIFNYTHFSR